MKLGAPTSSARGEMIRKALFLIGNKHLVIRKRHFGISRRRYVVACSIPQRPLPQVRRYSNDPPPPSHRHRHNRFRRPHRLLGHDSAEERCDLPSDQRFIDLPLKKRCGLPGRNNYWAATAALRSSEIVATTGAISSGVHGAGAAKGPAGRGVDRTPARTVCDLKAT